MLDVAKPAVPALIMMIIMIIAGCCLAATARAGDECALIPHGSFDAGATGWSITDDVAETGDAQAMTDFGIIDGSVWGGGTAFDTSVLVLQVSASAGLVEGHGRATAEVIAATTVVVEGRRLRVRKGGGFELQYLGAGGHEFLAVVWVEGADGRVAAEALYRSEEAPGPACLPGLAILGSFDVLGPTVDVDLAASGIEYGDEVTISVGLHATAGSGDVCQWTYLAALLLVDEFEFCDLDPGPGDLDGDGAVGLSDLILLLASWGACPAPPAACPGDLDGDGTVGFDDLLVILADWS